MAFQQSQFGQLENQRVHSGDVPPRLQPPIVKANSAAILGNFDGVVRPAEAIGVLVFFLATTFILGFFILILWLVGVGPEWRRNISLVTEALIFAFCIYRLAGDLLQFDPTGMIFEVKEFREWRDDYQAFKKWRLAEEYGSPRTVEHQATITVKSGPNTLHYFGLQGDDLERCVKFAGQYLEAKAAGAQNLTAEKNWVGKNKLWAAGAAGRESWKEFKEFWLNNKMVKLVDGRGTWKFTETGEKVLAEFAAIELEDE